MSFKSGTKTNFMGNWAGLFFIATMVCGIPVQTFGQLIDFETDGSGNPWTSDRLPLPTDEYITQGVLIGSSRSVGATVFTFTDSGTSSIQGYKVQSGATAGIDTFLDLTFVSGVTNVAFDWYTSTEGTSVSLSIYDTADSLITVQSDISDADWSGFNAGSYSLDLGGQIIGRIRIEDQPVGTHIVGIDNLAFTPVPIPLAVWLFGSGFIGLIGIARRRKS